MKLKIKDAAAAKSVSKPVGATIELFDHVAKKWIAKGWATEIKKAAVKEEKAEKETKEFKAVIETKDATN